MNKLLLLSALLLSAAPSLFGQGSESVTYSFRDPAIVEAGETADGVIQFFGPYNYQGAQYGLNVKDGGYLTIDVMGNTIIRFLGSEYSSLNMVGTAVSTGDLGTVYTQVAVDLQDTYEFTYSGEARTLTFSLEQRDGAGSDLYLPALEVIPVREPVMAEAGKTYTYDFTDGSVLPRDASQTFSTLTTEDGILTINSNGGGTFRYNDPTHGGAFGTGNSFDLIVAGDALITFLVDQYSVDGVQLVFTDAEGTELATIEGENSGGEDGVPRSFDYRGEAGTLTATLTGPSGSVYFHGLSVANAPEVTTIAGVDDVWDFGAEQLPTDTIRNMLDASAINGWYSDSITPGTAGHNLPDFTAGTLSFVGGGNDRLRTDNTELTRYDENVSADDYAGRLYINSAGAADRYLSLVLAEDDEVTLAVQTDNGGTINFQYAADPAEQLDQVAVGEELTELTFVARRAGVYRIFDTQDKPSYYRISRASADYVSVSGAVDDSEAEGLPADYSITFTNEAGKAFTTTTQDGVYVLDLPAGYTYDLSLEGANGYIISNATQVDVTRRMDPFDLTIIAIELYTLSGQLLGLDGFPADFSLQFTSVGDRVYVPTATTDTVARTYTVQLEPDTRYAVAAKGVNDYVPAPDTLSLTADTLVDLTFSLRPTYPVSIGVAGLTDEQLADLILVFTTLTEEGYQYRFTDLDRIALRQGEYTIAAAGLEAYPVRLGLTSPLTVGVDSVSKALSFTRVTRWTFDDAVISPGDVFYHGLRFTGGIYNQVDKGQLLASPGSSIRVPVRAGEDVTVDYFYTANFTFGGAETFTTSSKSTSKVESATYAYTGEDGLGYVTIDVLGDDITYIAEIRTNKHVDYQPTLAVGPDRAYTTINGALDDIRLMQRDSGQRVTVSIDPGNYEEMLVIDVPDLTLTNAAADPSIALLNAGVDIDDSAVRITSYYGHGYNYYSMGDDQKYDAEVLRVNRERDALSYVNAGAGTTNGSYWNATTVVMADGFRADQIIFENSFNQYISRRESEDVVVLGKENSGVRPTDYGNTNVQQRDYVERAAAIAFVNGADRAVLNLCRVVGRQDAFYGGTDSRVVVYKGVMMGAVDYLFGEMTAVFYQTQLAMNTDDNSSSDRAYLTAPKQAAGRGYLMYETTVTSAVPGTESTNQYRSKPGLFGRPWAPTTSEAVFYNTTVETSDHPDYMGQSLILPEGWDDGLGGKSEMMYEYATLELSGVDNSAARVSWATVLEEPVLNDGTEITPYAFTQGNDGWDPLPALIQGEQALPVELISFNGQVLAEGNRLDWEVAREENFSHYEIERSVNSFDWIAIGEVLPSQSLRYTFTDSAAPAAAYYRLRSVDLDGTFEYSDVVFLQGPEAVASLRIFPNPSYGNATVRFPLDAPAVVSVYSVTGRLVRSLEVSAPQWQLADLVSGIYVIAVEQDGRRFTERVVVR